MGTAGVTTGTLTAEETAAQPVEDVGTLPGNIEIFDAQGNPTKTFVTDAKGQFVMKVLPTGGQTEVILTIGGEKFKVDLDEAAGSGGSGFEVTFDFFNFNSAAAEFESTATIKPNFDGKVPTGPVTWSVVSIQNPQKPWWLRGPSDPNGLTWGPQATPYGYMYPNIWPNFIMGPIPQGPVAQLTDVVGNRTVTVKAETTIDGVLHSRTIDVTFGDGPLSVFTSVPVFSMIQWAAKCCNASFGVASNFTTLNGSNPTHFPAAVQICGGSVNPGAITSTTTYVPHSATFDTSPGSGWRQASYNSYYSTTSKLPTVEQLQNVSGYGYLINPSLPRRGASYAAGWQNYTAMRTGQLYLNSFGFFDSFVVSLGNGAVMPSNVNNYGTVACVDQ
jgi:hypothetical protein